MNPIIAALSRLLQPNHRDFVCGDLAELQLSAPAAAANILGLVIRQQMTEWSDWRPWVALLGVVGVTGYFLSAFFLRLESAIYLQIRTYFHYRVAYQPGGVSVAQQIAFTTTAVVAMSLCSSGCGFVLAALSGRSIWLTSLSFYCVVRDVSVFDVLRTRDIVLTHAVWVTMLFRLLPTDPIWSAFLIPFACGIRWGRRGGLSPKARMWLSFVGLSLLCLLAWMENWFAAGFAHWSGQPFLAPSFIERVLPWLAGAWPLFSLRFLQGAGREIRQPFACK